MMIARRFVLAFLVGLALVVCGGCGRNRTKDAGPEASFVVRDSSEGLLLTWIDDKGDFHTELFPKDVPLVGRDAVKVVDITKDEGTHDDLVFVADLRTARPDGTYSVRAMTRAQFDEIAVLRRQQHGPTLAGGGKDAGSVAQNGIAAVPNQATTGGANPSRQGRPAVIVYGASWCGACHEATAYLRMKGIVYVEKDIEEDPTAAAEMKGKLQRAGLRSGSIPVLDVRGKVLVGFSPRAIDEALGKAT